MTTIMILFSLNYSITIAGSGGEDKKAGFCKHSINHTQKPQNNFYLFANGNWLDENPVPATESTWGSFTILRDQTEKLLKDILEEAASQDAETNSIRKKVGDFYRMAMDTVKLEEEGTFPIEEFLEKIRHMESAEQIPALTADFHSRGIAPLFRFYVMQDAKNSDEYICYAGQGGLGLPDRDYYFKDDEKSLEILKLYEKHISNIFALLNYDNAGEIARKIIRFEKMLAAPSMNRTELRNIDLLYNKMSFTEFREHTPSFNWDEYLLTLEMDAGIVNELIVTQPDFFHDLERIITTFPLEDLKNYYTWNLIRTTSSKLNHAFEQEHFNFYEVTLNGTKEMKPRWQRALAATNGSIGEALGQLYVERAFSPEAKEKVNAMVDNLIAAFRERIENLDWMEDLTKTKALAKLDAFDRKLGYPDEWKDYSELEIERISYVDNYFRAKKFEFNRMIRKLDHPVDRTEWGMPPQTVNAYYSPLKNEIVFPAAIMQAPFFDPEADDAVNYGGMGAVIGHEITHGFDDQGSKFDGEGNLNNWWTEEDRKRFNERTDVLVKQFNGYEVLKGLFVNGELTLGENIADLGGLSVAYYAYQKSLNDAPAPVIDGFTGDQRFFLGWAQVWKINMTPEYLRNMILTNPHAPGEFRVLGPLSNMPEFYSAFEVKEGHKMFRKEEKRAKIW